MVNASFGEPQKMIIMVLTCAKLRKWSSPVFARFGLSKPQKNWSSWFLPLRSEENGHHQPLQTSENGHPRLWRSVGSDHLRLLRSEEGEKDHFWRSVVNDHFWRSEVNGRLPCQNISQYQFDGENKILVNLKMIQMMSKAK